MPITESGTFDVEDADEVSGSGSAPVLSSSGMDWVGRGRLVHPTIGTYDYDRTPDDVVNLDAGVVVRPIWSHSVTLGGGVDALWAGSMRDVVVVERWRNGDVGAPIELARALLQMLTVPPVDPSANFVLWYPNYLTTAGYKVALLDLRSGGQSFTLDLRLASYGFTPQPLELEMRILGEAS